MEIRNIDTPQLSLTNTGKLSLFFIGIGSAFSKQHYQTNLLIIKGQDHILIDCGTKTPQALYELGTPITQIRNFLITHSHADHIGGLEEVMLLNRYVTKERPTIIINDIYEQILWNHSLYGGAGFNEEDAGIKLTFGDLWKIIKPKWLLNYPRETMSAQIGAIDLKIFRTNHIPDSTESWDTAFWSCGVIIDENVMFTSDTKFDRELVESYDKLFNLQVIFHDCQFFKGGVHASLEELNTLPLEIKQKMILTHYGDNWNHFEAQIIQYGFMGLGKQWHYYDF